MNIRKDRIYPRETWRGVGIGTEDESIVVRLERVDGAFISNPVGFNGLSDG